MMEDLGPPVGEGGVADHGVATSMQVVVKAANQKYNDQTIECHGSWTVKKLKAHLAEVYPCKPRENQQKIIFSGRLLQDHLVLKDVLRSFDPDGPTTVHLVCSPGVRSKEASKEPSPAPQPVAPANVSSSGGSVPSEVPSTIAQSENHNSNLEAYNAWMQQFYSGAHLRSRQNGSAGYNADMYHQYWQYYMHMQYAQYLQSIYGGAFPNVSPAGAIKRSSTSAASHNEAGNAPPAAVNAQPENVNEGVGNAAAAPPPAVGAAGGGGAMFEDDEEDGRNRDWLDWLYVGSRLGVLLSIIYFYSTVGRFMLVFGFCFLVYIVRNHLYANRNNNNRMRRNNNVNPANAAVVDAGVPAAAVAPGVDPADVRVPEPPAAENNDDRNADLAAAAAPGGAAALGDVAAPGDAAVPGDAAAPGDRPDEAAEELPIRPREGPSAWSFVVTVITTFFSSLVPQPPPGN